MHYFVDGYNFIFSLYDEVDPLREKREEVIDYLEKILTKMDLEVSIVFDSHFRKDAFFPKRFNKKSLEIIYTTTGQSADKYILEALSFLKTQANHTVVTYDKFLAKQAKILGAKVISIDAFIKMILKKQEKLLSQEVKQEHVSDFEFKRLLDAFEKSFRENED